MIYQNRKKKKKSIIQMEPKWYREGISINEGKKMRILVLLIFDITWQLSSYGMFLGHITDFKRDYDLRCANGLRTAGWPGSVLNKA